MKGLMIILTLVFWTTITAVGQDKTLTDIVSELGDEFERHIPTKRIEAIMALYSEDAKYLPDNEGLLIGREAIREKWERDLKYDLQKFVMTPVTVEGTKRLIYETGTGESTIKTNGQVMTFAFKYVNVWRKEKDGYKLVIDTFNRASPSGSGKELSAQ
ncbi:MAG: DUF4440 domain-containing protein [Bacteroidota bacterium]